MTFVDLFLLGGGAPFAADLLEVGSGVLGMSAPLLLLLLLIIIIMIIMLITIVIQIQLITLIILIILIIIIWTGFAGPQAWEGAARPAEGRGTYYIMLHL